MKSCIYFLFLLSASFFAKANINSDVAYENKLHQIYLSHYKNPVPHSQWSQFVSQLGKSYILKHKDTLWDLSSDFFKDNLYWSKLWVANPSIENPHRIYKGDSIAFDTKSLVAVTASPYGVSLSAQFPHVHVPPQKNKKKGLMENEIPSSLPVIKDDVFLREQISDIDLVLTPDPIQKQALLPVYLSEDSVQGVGEVVEKEGYGSMMLNGENIIVRIDNAIQIGGKYTIVSQRRSINSSLFNFFQGKGNEILIKGEIKVLSHLSEADSLYLAQVTKSVNVITKGDKLISGKAPVYTLSQKGTVGSAKGSIVGAFKHNSNIFSLYSIVYLDKGRSDGVQTGDIYYIRGKSPYSSDRSFAYKQPYIGKLRVIHTNPNSSTAIIVESKARIYINDIFTGSLELISDSSSLEHHEEIEVEEIDSDVPSEFEQNIEDSEEDLEEYLDEEGLEAIPEEEASDEDSGNYENIEENLEDVKKEFQDFEDLEDVEEEGFEVIDEDPDADIEKEYLELDTEEDQNLEDDFSSDIQNPDEELEEEF